jgi:hypothetical protein
LGSSPKLNTKNTNVTNCDVFQQKLIEKTQEKINQQQKIKKETHTDTHTQQQPEPSVLIGHLPGPDKPKRNTSRKVSNVPELSLALKRAETQRVRLPGRAERLIWQRIKEAEENKQVGPPPLDYHHNPHTHFALARRFAFISEKKACDGMAREMFTCSDQWTHAHTHRQVAVLWPPQSLAHCPRRRDHRGGKAKCPSPRFLHHCCMAEGRGGKNGP